MAELIRDAVLSNENPPRYRFLLTRVWEPAAGTVTFVGLNPSTADAERDDQTVTKCVGFARRWGKGRIHIVNVWPLRSTKPEAMLTESVPYETQVENTAWVKHAAEEAQLVVACWGSFKGLPQHRVDAVRKLVGDRWHALGFTQAGAPRHPSRAGYDTELVPWPLPRPHALAAVPEASPPENHGNDVCARCGHARYAHRAGTCLAWVPAIPLKAVSRDFDDDPIGKVTAISVATSAKGSAHDYTSSICNCGGFQPSGKRIVTPDDAEHAKLVREGSKPRIVKEIAEL